MESAIVELKKEVVSLKETAVVQAKKFDTQASLIANLQKEVELWQEKYRLAMIRRFAAQADRYLDPNAPKQDSLFDEAELSEVEAEEVETVEVAAHQKAKPRGKREALPLRPARPLHE